jgi:ribonucleoside-diphosphate reductase alpha chain
MDTTHPDYVTNERTGTTLRERLQRDREGEILRFRIISNAVDGSGLYETKGYIQSGVYPDGRLGEVFVKVGRPGASEALMDQWAISTSVALQHGAPVDELLRKFVGTQFEPSGAVVGVDGIKRCTSPLDLVSRYLLSKYGTKEST